MTINLYKGKSKRKTSSCLYKNFILIFNAEIFYFLNKMKIALNYPQRKFFIKTTHYFKFESYNKNNNHKFMFRNN